MPSSLTARQEECLRLTRFKTDKEIALALGLAEATVKKHVAEACQRLGVNRRKAALAILEQADMALDQTDPAEAPSIAPAESDPRRPLYRPPPRGALPRAAIIGIMAVLLVLVVQATTTVIFEVHGQVEQIDKAVRPGNTVGVVPSVRP